MDYPDSLPVSCFGSGDVASVDFLVPSGAKLLTGVAGIDDNTVDTNARVIFSVLDTAHKPLVPSKTLAYGQAWKLSVPLDGVGRIRLQTEYKSNKDLVMARWANMQFTF
jgi:NPCBM/NEW2 domain